MNRFTHACPVCWRLVKPHGTTMPRHFDSIGATLCPASGEPFRIAVSTTAQAVAS